MLLDRSMQLKVLKHYADIYPGESYEKWSAFGDHEHAVAANLFYLQEHGLVKIRGQLASEDGGLSAILGVVTIKLHDDTIKALVEQRILASNLPEPEKKRLIDRLRDLSAETTKHLVLKLVDLGLEKSQDAIALILKLLEKS